MFLRWGVFHGNGCLFRVASTENSNFEKNITKRKRFKLKMHNKFSQPATIMRSYTLEFIEGTNKYLNTVHVGFVL